MARLTGLASLRFSCQLDPRSACNPLAPRAEPPIWPRTLLKPQPPVDQRNQPLPTRAGGAGCLRHPSSFLHRTAVLQKGSGGCVWPHTSQLQLSAPPLPTLLAQTLVRTLTTVASCPRGNMARGQETHHAQVTEQLPGRPSISLPRLKSAKSVPPGDLTQAMLPALTVDFCQTGCASPEIYSVHNLYKREFID